MEDRSGTRYTIETNVEIANSHLRHLRTCGVFTNMKRRFSEVAQTVLRLVKPAILPKTSKYSPLLLELNFPFHSCREAVDAVCGLGPSPIRWSRLWREAREKASREITQTRLNFEHKRVALLNAMTISPSGTQILSLSTPAFFGSLNLHNRVFHSSHLTPSGVHQQLRQTSSLLRRVLFEVEMWLRLVKLWLLFTPVVLWAPFALQWNLLRSTWIALFRWSLERAGPAFIKWGQWGATRPDLLPLDLCRSLESLHNAAPKHSFEHSRQEIEKAFGIRLEVLFEEFETQPVASGSVAQVHRAKLTPLGASYTSLKPGNCVAVKVRHPGVKAMMEKDFKLMMRACSLSRRLPFLAGLRLDESIRQFGTPLHEQLDFQLEARNLDRFQRNFRLWNSVGFPRPLYPFVSQSVLIESFEDGDLISNLVHNPDYQTSIEVSHTGVDVYLKMLMRDNFLHADLHPGNILVQNHNSNSQSYVNRVLTLLRLSPQRKLVLLDAGMVTELTPQDQKHVVTFFDVRIVLLLK